MSKNLNEQHRALPRGERPGGVWVMVKDNGQVGLFWDQPADAGGVQAIQMAPDVAFYMGCELIRAAEASKAGKRLEAAA